MSAKGMLTTMIVTQIVDAVTKDETPEAGGCDISAGMFGPNLSTWVRDLAETLARQPDEPIPMVLHCPACGLQHIDKPFKPGDAYESHCPEKVLAKTWTDPAHRSHLCRPEDGGCDHIWRPADVPTTGVAAIATRGKADSPLASTVLHNEHLRTAILNLPADVPPEIQKLTSDHWRTWRVGFHDARHAAAKVVSVSAKDSI